MEKKQFDISNLEPKWSSEQIAEHGLKRAAEAVELIEAHEANERWLSPFKRAAEAVELIEAHEANERWLSPFKRAAYWVRQAEAVELIEALKWQDLSRATKWVKKHKERLTDVSTLAEILAMARAYGASDDEESIRETVAKELKEARSAIGKKGAEAKRQSDPKQAAMNEVKANWETWQKDRSTYRSKAAFIRDQLAAYPILLSAKYLEDKCRKWEKESVPKKP
ncbi:hypothetical protein [Flavobacterium sp.]|jgi:ElaB/YqjD/DUF883 family membrane-anchored ribosome-binding protein|uniref:hypothetical protein n=1 Tax=Flavobacterium sp. TaxID=239 RepID=UPI0037BF2FE7